MERMEKDNLIGNSIKEFRLSQNMTQKQFAQIAGVTHAAISYWENGVNIPNIRDCWRIADVFGVTIDEVVGRTPK